jgi:hypothetical protein
VLLLPCFAGASKNALEHRGGDNHRPFLRNSSWSQVCPVFRAARNRRSSYLRGDSLVYHFDKTVNLNPYNKFLCGYFPASCSFFSRCLIDSEVFFASFGTKPYCAAFSRSRIAPQERQTATPCLMRSAQTGHSASGRAS